MRRAFVFVVAALVAVLVSGAAALVLVIYNPQLVVNERSARWAATVAAPFGYAINWQRGTVDARSYSFWDKELAVDLGQLCVRIDSVRIDGCFDRVALSVRANLRPADLRFVAVGPVTVIGGPMTIALLPPPSGATPDAAIDWLHLRRPAILKGATLQPVSIQMRRVSLELDGVAGSAESVSLQVSDERDGLRVAIGGKKICGRTSAVRIDGCVSEFALTGQIGLRGEFLHLDEVGPLLVAADELAVELPRAAADGADQTGVVPGADAAATGETALSFAMPDWLKQTTVKPLSVRVDRWKVSQPGSFAASGAATLDAVTEDKTVRAAIDLGSPCASLTESRLQACFKRARLGLSLRGDGETVRLAAVGPIGITGGDVVVNQRGSPVAKKPAPPPSSTSLSLVPSFLKGARLKPVHAELTRLVVLQDGAPYIDAKALLDGRVNAQRAEWSINADATVHERSGVDKQQVHVMIKAGQDAVERIAFRGEGSLTQAAATAQLTASGSLRDGKLRARFAASTQGFVSRVQSITAKDCTLALDGVQATLEKLVAGLSCDVVVKPERFSFEDDLPIKMPPNLTVQFTGEARTGLPPSVKDPFKGRLQAHLAPLGVKEIKATADIAATAGGTFEDLPQSLDFFLDGRIDVAVERFQDLVKALEASRYAVPAPLNVLDGRVDVAVSAKGTPMTRAGLVIPLSVVSRLRGAEQSLDTDTSGVVTMATTEDGLTTDVKIKALLSDVQLALPDMTIRSRPPQLVRDKRIERAAALAEKPAPSLVSYDVSIATPPDKPARLLSNLALKPIPLGIDYHLSSAEPGTGKILVQEFPLNLFRRDARVEHFKVQLQGPDEPATLDGLLRVTYSDYVISIKILGDTETPIVQLTSNPPRTERELAAILLFGKDMSDLDEDQLKSAESFRAAAADGALSLASMYLLASTPVESVGYDPQAKAFTAKVSIGKGASLNLGSDFDGYQRVGVRKRLGGAWSVETFGEYKEETDERSVTALFEWSMRY